jgi:hypothetical protein
MARHLTEAAREWMKEAEARGYSETEAMFKLLRAFYEKNNQLPPLPEVRIATASPSPTTANSPVDLAPTMFRYRIVRSPISISYSAMLNSPRQLRIS